MSQPCPVMNQPCGGDKLSLNSQAFRGRKRISKHGKHLEPAVFSAFSPKTDPW